ncbi:MAG TPA: DNA repair protein RecN [Chthoniobacterales bacterium]|nr:DNA repair protein RecN [Chthoniobacterales bacterium]
MLLSLLRIKNLALVEDLEWELAPGFLAITGETGAGKSIIIGALKLLLGERADKSLIRTGAEACTVEAIFNGGDFSRLNAQLEESGVETGEGELLLKRSFSLGGSNRQFVNGSPTTLALLKTLGDELVDLHGPHDHQSLLVPERQLSLLDGFARAEALLQEYQEHFRQLQSLLAEEKALSTAEAAREQELDLLRHQIGEINAAQLQPNEEEEIHARYRLASNSRRLIELATTVSRQLSETDDAILQRLAETQRLLRELEKIDPSLTESAEAHATAVIDLTEIARTLDRYAEKLDLDPEQLAQLELRVTQLETLKRKYGGSLSEAISFGARAAERLRKIEGRDAELERLAGEIKQARNTLDRAATALRKARTSAAPKLAKVVRQNLADLGFRQCEFEAKLSPNDEPRLSGTESLELLFSPNPGEPLKPLRTVASSGEISRVMLAIKSALAMQDSIPLLVFDEIDANVGGEIANAVGAKMLALAEKHQVLCITHLPQVAAAATTHFVVTKEVAQGRTFSALREINGKAREEEIARMLGGRSDSALKHAASLLKPAKNA